MNEKSPLSVQTVLFGPSEPAKGLEELLRTSVVPPDAEGRASPELTQLADSRLAGVASPLLDIDIGEVVRVGLTKHRSLVEAAQRSVAAPGSEEAVELATHTITSVHDPRIDIYVDEDFLTSVHFTVNLTIVVRALLGIVRAGKLIALTSGDATVAASLLCEGAQLLSQSRELDLPTVINLGIGVELLPGADPGE